MIKDKFEILFGSKEKKGKFFEFIKKAFASGMALAIGFNIAGANLAQGIGGLSEIFLPKTAYAQTLQTKPLNLLLGQWASFTQEYKGKVVPLFGENMSFSSLPDGRTGLNFYLRNGKVLFLPFGETSFYDINTKKVYTPNAIESKALSNSLQIALDQILEMKKMQKYQNENIENEKIENERLHPIYNIPEKLSIYDRENFNRWVEILARQFDDKRITHVFTKTEFEEFLNTHKPYRIKDELKLKDNFEILVFSDRIGSFRTPVNVVIVNEAKKSVFTADELAREISIGIRKNSDALLPYLKNEKSTINQMKDVLATWRDINNTARETLNQVINTINIIDRTKRILGK
ncbi:MAG: hypothetical protein QW067_07620 [Thermofilaceae archaeon]